MKRQKNGFTLFEMLVVISIIGVLVALVSASFSGAQKRARDAKRISDMNSIQKAAEQYYALSNGAYPTNNLAPGTWTVNSQVTLDKFPTDPKTGYTTYSYNSTGANGTYCACALLEVTTGNYGANNCSTAGTNYYCVNQKQ